jgi:hypothetical protein
MSKKIWITGIVILLVLLSAPALRLNHDNYTALATGVQAFGVIVALFVASETLVANRRDYKTDRALALHAELVSGPLNDRRVRLVDHLREHGNKSQVASATREDLKPGGATGPLAKYSGSDASPLHDANALLRFFERANAACTAGVVEGALFHELLGGHALWWHTALIEGEQLPVRIALSRLAAWTDQYTKRNPAVSSYMAGWERNLARDFGDRRKVATA